MTVRSSIFSFLACFLLAGLSFAQIGRGEAGLLIAKASGTAGSPCPRNVACALTPTKMRRGERVTLMARGVRGRPFAIALGLDQNPLCLRLPGFHNLLAFSPAAVPWAGVLVRQDMIRACPGGLFQTAFSVPTTVPKGSVVLFQALVFSYLAPNQVPTFTEAFRATVE